MKKFLLSTAILLLVLAVVSGQTYAGKMVSINFAQGTNQVFSDNPVTPIGPFATNSDNWNNTAYPTTGTLADGTLTDLIDNMGVPTGIDIEWASSGVGYNNDGIGDNEHKISVGYLDDQKYFGSGVSITLTNIPYANYTIYGLFSSNAGDGIVNFDVNGTWALGGDETTTAAANTTINANMSANGEYWTLIEPGVAGNYWKVDTTGATCTIEGEIQNDTKRGRLCGLVIVSDEPSQRSHSVNFCKMTGGWEYHDEISWYSVPLHIAGYENEPNKVPHFLPTSGWSDILQTFDGQIKGERIKIIDQDAKESSAILIPNNDFSWDTNTGGDNVDNTLPGADEATKNLARLTSRFFGHYPSLHPAEGDVLASVKKVPYGKYNVVAYLNVNGAHENELTIEDTTYYYVGEPSVDFKTRLLADPNSPHTASWLIATDTVGPPTQVANLAIFKDLSDYDLEIMFNSGVNSGFDAFEIFAANDADDVVTQVTPGNVDKDFGDTPVSINTELSWNAPVNGADSYDVYLSEYNGDDPNLYLVEAGNTIGSYTPTLEYGKTYVWKIDVVRGAETISGDYFYFDVEGDPVLQVQPRSVSVEAGTDTFVTVGALLTDNYQWFYSVDDVIGDDTEVQSGPDATLDITNVTEGVNTGYYFCVLTNNIAGSNAVTSDLASLEIGQFELYLPFDGDPNDASGNDWDIVPGNRVVDANGIITPTMGTISYETGYDGIGQAAKFTRGSGDQLEVLDSDDYFNYYTKGFTVRFWVKPTYEVGGYLTYMGKSSNDWNAPSTGWRMYDEGEYASQGYSANMSPLTYNTPQGRLDDGNWHMLACTYDGATMEMNVYQNGFLQGTLTGLLGPTTSYPLVIGNQYKDGTTVGWGYEGLIDEIEIFSYAVSEYDMLDDYATKTGLEMCFGAIEGDVNGDCKVDVQDLSDLAAEWLDTTNPGTPPMTRVVNWQFDETSGLTAADSSGNGIDGTLGAGFADDADAQWVIDGGRIGTTGDNALYINGDPNTWVITDSNSISLPFTNGAGDIFEATSSWTINLWIKFASEYAASQMVNIGGFGYNEWPSDPDPDGNSDRYFASYSGGYEFEVGQDGIWPSNPLGDDWTMMTATYDGTTCIVYYNGQQVAQQDVALVDAIEEINLNTARQVLWDYGTTVPMNATVDDFSIWSETFGAAQILGMYENSFPSCDGAITGDVDGDCIVGMEDFAIIASDWLECNIVPSSSCD